MARKYCTAQISSACWIKSWFKYVLCCLFFWFLFSLFFLFVFVFYMPVLGVLRILNTARHPFHRCTLIPLYPIPSCHIYFLPERFRLTHHYHDDDGPPSSSSTFVFVPSGLSPLVHLSISRREENCRLPLVEIYHLSFRADKADKTCRQIHVNPHSSPSSSPTTTADLNSPNPTPHRKRPAWAPSPETRPASSSHPGCLPSPEGCVDTFSPRSRSSDSP